MLSVWDSLQICFFAHHNANRAINQFATCMTVYAPHDTPIWDIYSRLTHIMCSSLYIQNVLLALTCNTQICTTHTIHATHKLSVKYYMIGSINQSEQHSKLYSSSLSRSAYSARFPMHWFTCGESEMDSAIF